MPKVRRDAVNLVKYRHWSMRKVALRYGVQPSTVSRWCKHPLGTGWHEIPTASSAPKRHPNALGAEIVSAIIQKRIGRRRCGQHIYHELKREGVEVSLPSVQRTLSRCGLLKKRSPWKRPHDYTERPEITAPGSLLEADTVHIMLPNGLRLYVYTLIDLYSRWAYAEVTRSISSAKSFRFVEKAKLIAPFQFQMVQTDNGGEFQKMFLFRVYKLGLTHRYSRVRQSNDQAHIERFNRTIQEECLDRTTQTIHHFRKAIKTFLPYYNSERTHMGINYQTPLEVLRRC
ncbi:MAG TPA: integrase core domain-containing protein [Candidatus Paceibacterota bacterium]